MPWIVDTDMVCAGNIEEDVKILQIKTLEPKFRLATRLRLQEKLVVQVGPRNPSRALIKPF